MVGRKVTIMWDRKEDGEKKSQKGSGRVGGIVTLRFGIVGEEE